MTKSSTEAPTALVTGASSGIGYELADLIAADGYNLILTARREKRLQQLADRLQTDYDIEATVIPQDLSEKSAAVDLYQAVENLGIEIDTLVNNAGIPLYGSFTETDYEAERDMMQVNMIAVTELTKMFVPSMVDNGRGAILNTASLASFYPIPRKAVYAATKSYVLSFSRALAHELEDEGITVTALCPGAVETEYAQRGNVDESNTMDGISNDPRSVAKAGWNGLKNGERIVLPSAIAKYAAQIERILPRRKATEIGESTVEEGQSWI